MIRTLDQFHGRQREIERVMARIDSPTPQSVSIVGQRRIGKSSLLWHLTQTEIHTRYLQTPECYLFALLDFQGMQHLDQEGFCRQFGHTLNAAVDFEVPELRDFSAVEATVQELDRAGMRLVCLFDEFETVTRNAGFGAGFFGFLRALANGYPVAFITASRRPLQNLCHTQEISESPFFNIFAQIRLGPLSSAEVHSLITAPSAAAGLPLEPHCDAIVALSGRLPFFVQMACSATFECLVEKEEEQLDIDQVERRFLEEADAHFRYLWEGCEEEERQVITLLANAQNVPPQHTSVFKELATEGYIENGADGNRLFSRCFAAYLPDLVPPAVPEPATEVETSESTAPQNGDSTQLPPLPEGVQPFPKIIGQSTAIRRVFALIQRAAASEITVLLTGETGTGKELVARTIHEKSQRHQGPFVAVNCGAIAEHLQESEFFGHKKGAFTDAHADRQGLFEAADGGTLFLDEIGETSLSAQVKLLRTLQEGEVRRVGENIARPVNVRLICATNRLLDEEIAAGRFREDLYYRLYVLAVKLPPLRQRRSDIPLLVEHFLATQAAKVSPAAMTQLQQYAWPGNIRELENQLASAGAMAGGDKIEPEHLWSHLQKQTEFAPPPPLQEQELELALPLKDAREQFEKRYIHAWLQKLDWDLDAVSARLDLSRSRLYELIRRHDLKEE